VFTLPFLCALSIAPFLEIVNTFFLEIFERFFYDLFFISIIIITDFFKNAIKIFANFFTSGGRESHKNHIILHNFSLDFCSWVWYNFRSLAGTNSAQTAETFFKKKLDIFSVLVYHYLCKER